MHGYTVCALLILSVGNLVADTGSATPPLLSLPNELYPLIFQHLDMLSIARLRISSPHLSLLVSQTWWHECEQLGRSFNLTGKRNDDFRFLELLDHHDAIVVGLSALRILHRDIAEQDQMVLFARHGLQAKQAICDHGYSLVEGPIISDDGIRDTLGYTLFGREVESVWRLWGKGPKGEPKEIIVVGTKQCSPIALTILTPSTLFMSFISTEGVFSLYPKLTSQRMGLLNMRPPNAGEETPPMPALKLLQEAGFSSIRNVTDGIGHHVCEYAPECPMTRRGIPGSAAFSVWFREGFHFPHSIGRGGLVSAEKETVWRLQSCWTCLGSDRLWTAFLMDSNVVRGVWYFPNSNSRFDPAI